MRRVYSRRDDLQLGSDVDAPDDRFVDGTPRMVHLVRSLSRLRHPEIVQLKPVPDMDALDVEHAVFLLDATLYVGNESVVSGGNLTRLQRAS